MNNILQKSLFFSDYNKHRLLFGLGKAKPTMLKKWTIKGFLNTINALFERFGVVIRNKQKSKKIKGKCTKINNYTIETIINIEKFIKINNNKFNFIIKKEYDMSNTKITFADLDIREDL